MRGGALIVVGLVGGLSLIGSPASATPTAGTHVVPPAAPTPSAAGKSPDRPDPHPSVGGIGPNGELVGGAALQSRGVVTPKGAPALPDDLTAHAFVVVDLDSGGILAAKDPHGRYQPASILKTLTSITLIPRLPGDKVVTISHAAANAEGSAVGIVEGGKYSVDTLFKGLLMVSGNDTAAALAEAAGGVNQTVAMMNAEALKLGAYDTLAETPSGLDGWQQLTSAYDMALFLRAAVNMPRFIAYDETRTTQIPEQHANGIALDSFQIQNQSNLFFNQVPGALVSKTGFTDAARHTYVAATERGGRRIGVVFLRAERWPLDQWQQAAKLFNWAYSLPKAATPVGRLDAPAATPTPQPSGGAADAGQGSGSATTRAATTNTSSRGGTNAVIVVVGLSFIGLSAWWVRTRHPHPSGASRQTVDVPPSGK